MRHFGTAVLGRSVYCRLDAARLEQTRANLIKAELLGSGFAPLNADQVRSVETPTLLRHGAAESRGVSPPDGSAGGAVPHAERIEAPGASHLMHEENASIWPRSSAC